MRERGRNALFRNKKGWGRVVNLDVGSVGKVGKKEAGTQRRCAGGGEKHGGLAGGKK